MVRDGQEQTWLTTVSLVILAVTAVAVVLVYTRTVMIPFVVALFIVSLVSPVQDFQIKRLKLPRVVAVVITLLVVLFVIALVGLFVTQAIYTIVSTAGEYSAGFAYVANKALEPIEYLYRDEESRASVEPNGAPAGPAPTTPAQRAVPEPNMDPRIAPRAGPDNDGLTAESVIPRAAPKAPRRLNTKNLVRDLKNYIFNILTNAVGRILGLISGVFFVSIFVIFLLAGRDPYAVHSQVQKDIVQKIRRYVGTKVAISVVTGLLVWASLATIGLDLASVFGVLAFLLNFIPSIGSIISTLLPIPIAVVQPDSSPWLVVLVVLVPGTIQIVVGSVIDPKLMGEGLNLHPVTILLALSFWGLLWGIVGMFLAAPITAAIRIALMQFDTLRPIGRLLSGDFSKEVKDGP